MPRALRHALVLTAGLGTRLRPLTLVRAKPAIPLAGIPLACRIVEWLAAHGVTELVLNLHYRPESIAGVIGDGRHLGARVRYSWEQPAVLGSAGGPKLALPLLTGEATAGAPFFIVNGDTLTDVDLGRLAADHEASGALVTMALIPNLEPDHYGGVRLGRDGFVTGFVRRGPAAVGSYHFIGVQVASAAAFADVPVGAAANSVGEVYDRLLARQARAIRGFVCDAGFWDIGTVDDYWRTSRAFAPHPRDAQASTEGHAVQIASTAQVVESILWDRVVVGPHAILERCIVTDDVQVPAGSVYRNAILLAGRHGTLIVEPRPGA